MKICEIFYSIEGEGKRAGVPCVFIRRSGCNLHCRFDGKDCDTPYRDEGKEMTIYEIMSEVEKYGCKTVTLTGGEPLLPHPDLIPLRRLLCERGFEVNIETNGTMETHERFYNEFFTVDYKCNCSQESEKMNKKAFDALFTEDVIKFVVAEEDLEQVKEVVKSFATYWYREEEKQPRIYLSPCYGRINLAHLADWVKELKEVYSNIGLSLQIHKIIWRPEERGV